MKKSDSSTWVSRDKINNLLVYLQSTPHQYKYKGFKEMNEPMSDSYKREVEEFKKWADNSLGRCEDFRNGVSPRPRYEPPMSTGINDMPDK